MADLAYCRERDSALIDVHLKGRLLEGGLDVLAQFWSRFWRPGARHVVIAVNGALLTWDVRSIAGKGNEVGGYSNKWPTELIVLKRTLSGLSAP
jgi:hypothetical protein